MTTRLQYGPEEDQKRVPPGTKVVVQEDSAEGAKVVHVKVEPSKKHNVNPAFPMVGYVKTCNISAVNQNADGAVTATTGDAPKHSQSSFDGRVFDEELSDLQKFERRAQQADEVVFKGIALGDAFPEWEVSTTAANRLADKNCNIHAICVRVPLFHVAIWGSIE